MDRTVLVGMGVGVAVVVVVSPPIVVAPVVVEPSVPPVVHVTQRSGLFF